ncbi:MAG: hypothetical protein LBQ93_04445 [Treponema sp.]|jgi:hypothetical protein|nr:hypothetical protein [Treponema sp.]
MKKFVIFFFILFYVNCIYSFGEDSMLLENLYNEIVLHRSQWENILNEHNIIINYEDILRMKYVRIEIYDVYHYQNMVFEPSKTEKGKYYFHVLTDLPERRIHFFIYFTYNDGNYCFQNYELHFYEKS